MDPTKGKGITGFFQSIFKSGEKKSEKKDPLAEIIKQEKKEELPKLSLTHKVKVKKEEKSSSKQSKVCLPILGFFKKPKAEVKAEAVPLYKDQAEQREFLLRNITVTFETLLEKMEGQEKLPVGLFRMESDHTFREALEAGNKNKIDSILRSQFQATDPEAEFIQIASFVTDCARYVNEHPELFKDEKDIAALRESLKPLGQIITKIVQNKESTLMDWANINRVVGQSVIPVCKKYGIDLPKPLPEIPAQKSRQGMPLNRKDVPKEEPKAPSRVIRNRKDRGGMRINPGDIPGTENKKKGAT